MTDISIHNEIDMNPAARRSVPVERSAPRREQRSHRAVDECAAGFADVPSTALSIG
jgi:hypothetical protein